jgi:hypothetical protein
MGKRKPGPKPKPRREVRRHNVLVKLNDAELSVVKKCADGRPLATFLRLAGLSARHSDAA